jgi:hypothetical protein
MDKLETQRDYDARIKAVFEEAREKARKLTDSAESFVSSERESRRGLLLKILYENRFAENIVRLHRVADGGNVYIYSLMQVAKPKVIDYPIGAIELIDRCAENGYMGTDFSLFEMNPEGDLNNGLAARIKSTNGEDMPHMQKLVEQFGINPLYFVRIVEGTEYTDKELLSAIQNFRG